MSPELTELLSARQVELIVTGIAAGVPVLALLLGAVLGRRTIGLGRGLLLGGLIGLLGPVAWGLWLCYSGIVGHFGLDSVKGLLLNLSLFCLVGVLAGVSLGRAWRRLVAKV